MEEDQPPRTNDTGPSRITNPPTRVKKQVFLQLPPESFSTQLDEASDHASPQAYPSLLIQWS
jgi:hypothetical protein